MQTYKPSRNALYGFCQYNLLLAKNELNPIY
jgi:hypothetical protein